MPPNHAKSTVPYVLVLLAGMIWGLTFPLARIATEQNAHPIGLAFWQAIGGSFVLFLVCVVRRSWPGFSFDEIKRYCVIALLGTAIPGTLYFYAASRVPVGILAITVALVPMFTYGLTLVLRIDHYQRKRFIGIILGFIAIVLLMAPETSLPEPGMAKWVVLALVATMFYTFENVYVDARVPEDTDMIVLLMGGLFIAGVLLVPLMVVLDAFVPLSFPLDRIDMAIISMMVVSSVAYVMFLYIIKLSGSVFASVTAYVITLSGVFWGILIFDERHSIWVWSALVLMFSGMALVTPRERMQQELVRETP